ncbi:MAG: DNA repair protein RecO [Candidatus Delongbacteria bacterium]|jgi:DNA repair protein RecO (recombination protein O)|nr:DNA repair protein RecO [Candidatus Delongbacteria bacterium]
MIKEINTDGIVIRSDKYGENGRLLYFLTPDHGIISIVKHGFNSKKNIGRSILQPMNYVKLEIIEEKNKYKINDFELLDNFDYIRSNYDRIETILNIFTVLNKLPLNDLDGNRMIFFLVKKLLEATDKNTEFSSNNTKIYFYYQLAWCLGINFNISTKCSVCSSNEKLEYIDISNGNLLCKNCKSTSEYSFPVSENLSKILIDISEVKFDRIYKIKDQKDHIRKEFINMFNLYTDFHINHKIVSEI